MEFDQKEIDQVLPLCTAFANEKRLQILFLCFSAPCSVGELVTLSNIPQSLVSHHLRILKEAALLGSKRAGKKNVYSLKDDHVRCILSDLIAHSKGGCL